MISGPYKNNNSKWGMVVVNAVVTVTCDTYTFTRLEGHPLNSINYGRLYEI